MGEKIGVGSLCDRPNIAEVRGFGPLVLRVELRVFSEQVRGGRSASVEFQWEAALKVGDVVLSRIDRPLVNEH